MLVCFLGLVLGSFSVFGLGSSLDHVCVRLESSWKGMVRTRKWWEVLGRRAGRARFVRLTTPLPSVCALGFRFVLFGVKSCAFARKLSLEVGVRILICVLCANCCCCSKDAD